MPMIRSHYNVFFQHFASKHPHTPLFHCGRPEPCAEKFTSPLDELQVHETLPHPRKILCAICGYQVHTDKWKEHWENSLNHRICANCDLNFEIRETFQQHNNTQHAKTSAALLPADPAAITTRRDGEGMRPQPFPPRGKEDVAHVCTTCDAIFMKKRAAQQHCQSTHPELYGIKKDSGPVQCRACKRTCAHEVSLYQHMTLRHPELVPPTAPPISKEVPLDELEFPDELLDDPSLLRALMSALTESDSSDGYYY
ncbi:hypothetical protein EIP91_001626 [Steccherinum ochraceum]|uniref:C2H2-type domain-containing protein n=1 Tax=Steccherinum ochraceum TaxID=92696 RepID=A0A4R0RHF3_9APHY|nr:hypothetical protein EIP91_001626 [Steccherinum ochraceum]